METNLKQVVLNGHSLTIDQIKAVAKMEAEVVLAEESVAKAKKSREVVLAAANKEKAVYGLNTGVGANKDNRITENEFHKFNEQILYSHSIAIAPFANRETVRATLLCRLNSLMNGITGVDVQMAYLLRDMMNMHIHPCIPERGSVGMADLGNMAYVGLALIGTGKVEYNGETMTANEAFEKCGLKPLILGVKEGLPIVSNNAFSAAKAALLCDEVEAILSMVDVTYAMGFEAQGYNPMFIDPRSQYHHQMKGQQDSIKYVLACLEGSKIWTDPSESLEGSISYKSACAIHGSIRDSLDYCKNLILQYINSSDDCPVVLLEEEELLSTDNFIITGVAVAFEMPGIALSHLSKLICSRLLRLDDEAFSGLPRFLRPETHVISYATMQKTISTIDSEIRLLANPVSIDYFPTSNNTEDHGCNTSLVMRKTEKIVELLRYLIGIEAMHGAQAADLCGGKPDGKGTAFAYVAVRRVIPFLEKDNRELGADIEKAYEIVLNREILFKAD